MKKWVHVAEFEEWINGDYTIQRIRKKEKYRLIHNDEGLGTYDSLAEAKVMANKHKERV